MVKCTVYDKHPQYFLEVVPCLCVTGHKEYLLEFSWVDGYVPLEGMEQVSRMNWMAVGVCVITLTTTTQAREGRSDS